MPRTMYLEDKCMFPPHFILPDPDWYSPTRFKTYLRLHLLERINKKYPCKSSTWTTKFNYVQCMMFDILLAMDFVSNLDVPKLTASMDLLSDIEHISDLFMYANPNNWYNPAEFYDNPIYHDYKMFKEELIKRIQNL